VVDTFGLEFNLDPEASLKEMQRVCKKDGHILLMNWGKSYFAVRNYYDAYLLPFELHQQGYFNNRDWEEITRKLKLQVVQQERKQNGSLYFQILKNTK